MTYTGLHEGLATISADGAVPETRMKEADQVRTMVEKAIRNDADNRDWKRARVKGLVDGNPPHKHSALVAAGRADDCNVNWRIAKYFLGLAQQMVYDVVTEAETLATVRLANDDPQNEEWSQCATEQFQWLQNEDLEWDFTLQQSQGQMCLFGPGPQIFQDELDWRTCSIEAKALLLPERARSNPHKWEWAAIQVDYAPDQLYARIKNGEMARTRGWHVAATRRAIMNAHPETERNNRQDWSWHQDQLKNGTLYYGDCCNAVRTAHFFFREFPREDDDEGKITEVVVDLDESYAKTGEATDGKEFLFRKVRRYNNWNEIIHPMYWMHDVNGYHHSVNGLGIEMYAALEYENRLLCNLANDAMAPKIFFKPTTASERERMSIAHMGRYGILPAALDMVQQHVQPFLGDGIQMSREIQGLVSSNLSQFRSNALTKQGGNPVTARQIDYEASEQAKMGKTQLARIYEQYDWLYREKYRRAINPDLTASARGGKLALEFRKRCKKYGVSLEALSKIDSVRATRVVGQGSAFLRQQALEFLLGLMATLPESGREHLIRDVIAARAGHSHVERYAPRQIVDVSIQAQQSDALQQVAGMKVGVPPGMVSTQNPAIYASIFTEAAEGAASAIQQGGDPREGLAFLDIALPAAAQHLAKLAQDKSRKQMADQIEDRLKAVAKFAEQVKQQLAQMAQEQQAAQAEEARVQAGMDPETRVGLAKVESGHRVKSAKVASDAAIKGEKMKMDQKLKSDRARFDMAIEDAKTAAEIARSNGKERE